MPEKKNKTIFTPIFACITEEKKRLERDAGYITLSTYLLISMEMLLGERRQLKRKIATLDISICGFLPEHSNALFINYIVSSNETCSITRRLKVILYRLTQTPQTEALFILK